MRLFGESDRHTLWGRVFAAALLLVFAGDLSARSQAILTAALPEAPSAQLADDGATQSTTSTSKTQAETPLTLRRLPLRFLSDEAAIFTSPARIRRSDLKRLLPLAGATAVSLSTDTYTMRNVVSRNPDFNGAASTSSDVLRDSAIAVPVLLYFGGALGKDERSREAGLLGGEAMLDAYALDQVIKFATLRERPSQNDARGHFFVGDAASDPSFVSGHSIVAWSSAAVLAHEYSRPWQQAGIYTLATGVSLSRVLAQQHFPTDTLLGSAAGWLIGSYVYHRHHRDRTVSSQRAAKQAACILARQNPQPGSPAP